MIFASASPWRSSPRGGTIQTSCTARPSSAQPKCHSPARRRLVYAIANERVSHYSASVQVLADGEARSRLIWIVDVLPHEIAPYIDAQMDQAALAMQKTLGRHAA